MASHNLNSASSRSHSILSLTIEGVDTEGGGISSSKLQLVDLAGSERASLTGNEGQALKESIEINKSLFTLRQVITTLAANREGENSFVPYRDSKLTSLLKQSIGGNSYCLMIACLSPSDSFFEENISTLAYATKASCIANDPIKNIDPKTKLVKDLRVRII
jgi:Kinesin-like protein